MKYIKLLAIGLVATVVASCSNDDAVNTLETSLGFTQETLVIKENTGLVQIPIAIQGYRNGNVSVEIEAVGTGENPAVEGKNFVITDKNLKLLAENDTTNAAVLNVEFKTLDDSEINESREVTLTITAANGCSITKKSIVITLRDNDAAFFEKFFGKWQLTAKDGDDKDMSCTVTISGPSDEEDPDYDHILWVSAPALFNVGVALNCEWPMEYTFDKATKKGTLSHLMNQNYVATYSTSYKWVFVTDNGESYVTDPVTAEWTLGEGDSFPTTIEWGEDKAIYLYQPGAGAWSLMYDIKLTKL